MGERAGRSLPSRKQKKGGRLPSGARDLLVALSLASHEYRDERGTRELRTEEKSRREREREGVSAILENRIYPKAPTIGTAAGSAFVRRGTIDENAPRNSETRQRVDFDAHAAP